MKLTQKQGVILFFKRSFKKEIRKLKAKYKARTFW